MIVVFIILIIIGLWVLKVHIQEKKLSEDYEIVRLKNKLIPFFPELGNVKLMKGESSYTINKYRVFICLRDKQTNILYDDNMLTYVILHELAHSICNEIGHTEKFKAIFFNLLYRAEAYGLYNPNLPRPSNYCK